MARHATGCLICGQDLEYFDQTKNFQCEICGHDFEAAVSCGDGHFVCDACHAKAGYELITSQALAGKSKNPITVACEMMKNKFINMHGPEHHYLVAAALLASYKNSGGDIDLEKSLLKARERAGKVPGGICGLWGCCGAGVGSGIFVSIITRATPLSEDQWQQANQMTALSLQAIARRGGPRCCKRDTWLAILTALDFVRERFQIEMEKPEKIRCSFFPENPSCKKTGCLFYPGGEMA